VWWGPPGDPHQDGDERGFKDSLGSSSLQKKIHPNHDFYLLHMGPKALWPIVHSDRYGPVNSDLTESWWTCAI